MSLWSSIMYLCKVAHFPQMLKTMNRWMCQHYLYQLNALSPVILNIKCPKTKLLNIHGLILILCYDYYNYIIMSHCFLIILIKLIHCHYILTVLKKYNRVELTLFLVHMTISILLKSTIV